MVQVSMQNLIENPQYLEKQTNTSQTLSLSDDFFPAGLHPILYLDSHPHQRATLINSHTVTQRRYQMVWKTTKELVTKEERRQIAIYGIYFILGLSVLAWIIRNFQYIG